MDQTKSVNELNIERFRNLLETSINDVAHDRESRSSPVSFHCAGLLSGGSRAA
jgi:hypothetical protein